MAADTANGGLSQLEQHYDTFIVSLSIVQHDESVLNNPRSKSEQDIAEMAGTS